MTRRGFERLRAHPVVELAVTLAAAGLTSVIFVALKYALALQFDANAGFVIYIPAIAIVAWNRGLLGGMAVALACAVLDAFVIDDPLLVLGADVRDIQIRWLAYLIGGSAIAFMIASLRTARHRAEREAATRRRALELAGASREQLARMLANERRSNELRDAFNGIISHELRTPITAIYGGAKLLSRRSAETKDQTTRELIHDIEAEADRLYRLVEDLLVLARSERGTLEAPDEPVLLPRVVERLIQSERGRWRDRRFHVDIAGPVPAGHGEETYVEQVLRNLLDNAAKYSPDDTPISVVVDADSDVVRVRVLDEGPGIALAEARQLFELYYRSPDTTRMAGGAGIGLFVSRALIEAMGGRIWAARRPEGGSEFGFQLRRYEVDHEHAPEAAKHSGEPAAAASVAGKQP